MNELSRLIDRQLEALGDEHGPMSLREAARRSKGKISDFQLGRLLHGKANPGGIKERTAHGLADALDVSVDAIYEAARVPRPMSRWVMPEKLDRLPEAKRRIVEDVASAMLHAYDQGREGVRWGGPDAMRSRSTRK